MRNNHMLINKFRHTPNRPPPKSVTARVDQKCLSYNSHKCEISFHAIPYVQKIV